MSVKCLYTDPLFCFSGAVCRVNSVLNIPDLTLKEAVEYLTHPEENFQHCGATYIQHVTFKDENAKEEVRAHAHTNKLETKVKIRQVNNKKKKLTSINIKSHNSAFYLSFILKLTHLLTARIAANMKILYFRNLKNKC